MAGNEETQEKDRSSDANTLQYTLTQVPPFLVMLSAALQHLLMNVVASLTTAMIVADAVCAPLESQVRTRLFCSTMFMSGIATLCQTAFGVRLPVFQGPSASFFPVLFMLQKQIGCPRLNDTMASDIGNLTRTGNVSETLTILTDSRLRMLSGCLMASSVFEIVIGGTGLLGLFLRFIGPLTIAPTLFLIGYSVIKALILYSQPSWEIVFTGLLCALIFTLYISHLEVPYPVLCRKGRRIEFYPLFRFFPLLLTIIVMWGVSGILTSTNVFSADPQGFRYKARTDAKEDLITHAPWFIVPYPGQFGTPKFDLSICIGFIAGFCASVIESVGDYIAAARVCQVDAPPKHAVSRGILVEGLGGLLGGALGVGHATTSFTNNIAALSVSKIASRSVMLMCGGLIILFSLVGKVGAALASVPATAIIGVMLISCGLLVSVGLAAVQHVNLESSRNQTVLGTALCLGIFLPEWIDKHPDFINTGSQELNSVLKVTLGTPMFVGGILGVVLDNTARGSLKERGLLTWLQKGQPAAGLSSEKDNLEETDVVYEWSWLPYVYKNFSCLSKLPFMPPSRQKKANELNLEMAKLTDIS